MKLENNIILGDCLDILPEIPDEIFDLIIIDTPYNKKKDFKNDNHSKKNFINLFEGVIKNPLHAFNVSMIVGHQFLECRFITTPIFVPEGRS